MKLYQYILIFLFISSGKIIAQLDANSLMGLPTVVDIATMIGITTGVSEGSILYNLEDQEIYRYTGATNGWQKTASTPSVYVDSFIINAPGGTVAFSDDKIITVPFKPTQISFVAYPNIEGFPTDGAGSGGANTATLQNTFGTMNGFARDDGGATPTQAFIYSGGSGSSINSISRYASDDLCIGLRYTNNNGVDMGKITASLDTFDATGFTIDYSYTLGISGNVNRDNDILDESLIVLYTAYK